MTFSLRIRGLDEVEKKIASLEVATDLNDVLDTAGALLLHRIRTRFLAQENTQGGKWKESFAARHRRSTGRDGGTLFDSGDLFHSISLGRAGANERRIFTNIPYARQHNDGTNGQVKREFFGVSSADEFSIKNLIEARIRSAIR